jgi:hypothetical protein
MGRANSSDECNQKIDEYLEDVLDVPTVEEYREFNHSYSTAKKDRATFYLPRVYVMTYSS